MRKKIWLWAVRSQPEGAILPTYLLVLRFILYPLDQLSFALSRSRGFDMYRCMWRIRGLTISDEFFATMKNSNGRVYKITVDDSGIVRIDEVRLDAQTPLHLGDGDIRPVAAFTPQEIRKLRSKES